MRKSLKGLHKIFARRIDGLRAARLKQVVLTGGYNGRDTRDKVSVEFINKARPLYVQVLQYDGTAGTWSEIGRMQKARHYHAVAEVDGALFCPVGQTNKITIVHHHLIIILSLSYVFIK